MKIAFDGQLLLDRNRTGIAWNAHNLITELAGYPENECVIYCFSLHCRERAQQMLDEYVQMGCRVEYCGWFHNVLYKLLWNIIPVPHRLFFRYKPDITQFFNYAVPPGVRGKKVTIIHDLAYRSCPQTVSKKTRNWLRLCMGKTCKHADHIITDSEFSRGEILRYLKVEPDAVTVVPCAVDHSLYHAGYSEEEISGAVRKYQLDREYILYLGTIEPRKNLERLIDAYARMRKAAGHVPQLVLAGGKGWLCEQVYELPRKLHIEEYVVFTGYVSQEDAPRLMCGAKMFVFPSLYEGFGMPPLEAMACGTPVITSNTSSLPEVVGEAGITVDPENAEEIAGAMLRLNEDAGLRKELGEKGRQRAQEYTWEKSAGALMRVYRQLCGGE